MENVEKRNIVLAIVFSAALLFIVDALFAQKSVPVTALAPTPQVALATGENKAKVMDASVNAVALTAQDLVEAKTIKSNQAKTPDVIKNAKTIAIKTPSLEGSVRLQGVRFDVLNLMKYRETLAKDSPNITLFSPIGTPFPYFAEFGWISSDQNVVLPTNETLWETKDTELNPKKDITLTWDNKAGLKFFRQVTVDQNYMFKVSDRVENYGNQPVTLFNYGLVARTNIPESPRGAVHEGMVGYLDSKLKEISYDSIEKDGQASFKTTNGWAGITDKYWMSILAFDPTAKNVSVKFSEKETANGKHFQADYLLPPVVVEAGSAVQTSAHLFAGAKDLSIIDAYAKTLGIQRFDLTVDFGWYYFLTKPFFFILSYFYGLLGNMGLAILLFAFLLRLVMFPIANKSFKSMEKMKTLQPQIEKLKERYADDKLRFNQEMMALYQREKVNPAAGCLPMLIQIPVFFSLYKVLYISLELRQAPFYGWIHDLSAPDPTSILTLFGLINWPIPSAINIGVWPVLMGLTMWLQQKMSPKPTEKSQATILGMMPWVMMFVLGNLASGLVIYWTWSNILSIAQQYALKFQGKKTVKK